MPSPLQLRLGAEELLRTASSVTPGETGLVTGAQVAAYITDRLSPLTLNGIDYNEVLRIEAPKGASLSLQGGDSTVCLYMEGDLYVGNQNAGGYGTFFMDLPAVFSGGLDIHGGKAGQVFTKTGRNTTAWADLPASPSTASSEVYYEAFASPSALTSRTGLPAGWYGVKLLLRSSNGADACNQLFNTAALSGGAVCSVMGLAYGGTDNSSCPYCTTDGRTWLDDGGTSASRAMASILKLSFLYHHTGPALAWPGTALKSQPGEWDAGAIRYTTIPTPRPLTPP